MTEMNEGLIALLKLVHYQLVVSAGTEEGDLFFAELLKMIHKWEDYGD